jgi:TBC1 domain family member 10
MQVPGEDGVYLVRLLSSLPISTSLTPTLQGYCEGVVGRFAAAHVHFNGKLKTMIISKRSSTSKSPRPRSLTPSHRQQPSQSPAPSLSRTSSHEEDVSSHGHPSSSAPSVPNPPALAHPPSETSDASVESSHQDLLATPPVSYSSSSSVQESASPPTPLESYPEPLLRDKTRPYAFSGTSEKERSSPYNATRLPRQSLEGPETLLSSNPGPTLPLDILGIMQTSSLSSDMAASTPPRSPQSPSPNSLESSDPRRSIDDAGSFHLSHLSAAISDGAAGIGLSMLQGFISGNFEDEDDEDEDGDEGGDDSDHDFSSQSERERTYLEETVDGFPAPPTQIPTPSSRAPSFVLDARRPISSTSEYSEDGDGASFYDNYRYSRLSISSKMSKSSGYTTGTVPPPIPTELPPPAGHSQDSEDPAPPPSEPLSSPPETSSFSQPRETSQPTATQATRTIPPSLILETSALGPEPSGLVTPPVTSFRTTFGSPPSSPADLNTSTTLSPIAATFDLRGSGAASTLRQKIESDRGISSPLTSPIRSTMSDERTFKHSQTIVVKDKEEDVLENQGTQPQSSTSRTTSPSRMTSEKKKREGPPPLIVMNPAPPPPYTPMSPQSTGSSPTFAAVQVPTPIITHPPSQAAPEPAIVVSVASLFPPHPNAPEPNLSPRGILHGRAMAPMAFPPSTLLLQTMRKAIQMRVTPSGLPRFSTIYGSTAQDLSTALGPIPIHFSVDPPTDIPAKRIALAVAPPQAPVSISTQNTLPPPPGTQQSSAILQSATSNVIPRASFVPKAAAVRPRSRSFSGFDSPTSAGITPKERRFVLHLNF